MCTSFPLLDRFKKKRESGSFLPILPWICILPTNQYCFTAASCRTDPIHSCDLLFPQKPWWKSHHADPEWHFPGMAWDAVFTEAVSVTRSKGRSEWDSTVTVGKSRFVLCKVVHPATDPGSTRSLQPESHFLLACLSSPWLP